MQKLGGGWVAGGLRVFIDGMFSGKMFMFGRGGGGSTETARLPPLPVSVHGGTSVEA